VSQPKKLNRFRLPLVVDNVQLEIAGMRRDGTGMPLVFLHGFGSTKEDYADVIHREEFADLPVLAYDAPGCGETECSDLSAISIPFLVSTALSVLEQTNIGRFHLVGHSMGGLTGLVLADAYPDRVATFVDIEGNVAPEDCFLSRQIINHPNDDSEAFLAEFIDRAWNSRYFASTLYSTSVRHKVRPGAVRGIFESMVELSDHGDLMTRFLSIQAPKMFMYGEQNASLSYLGQLAENGVELAEISQCGHFPMYSNPPEMWDRITDFTLRHGGSVVAHSMK
jgi:pimeloyl-ACP methyl ester carboxylesterase